MISRLENGCKDIELSRFLTFLKVITVAKETAMEGPGTPNIPLIFQSGRGYNSESGLPEWCPRAP